MLLFCAAQSGRLWSHACRRPGWHGAHIAGGDVAMDGSRGRNWALLLPQFLPYSCMHVLHEPGPLHRQRYQQEPHKYKNQIELYGIPSCCTYLHLWHQRKDHTITLLGCVWCRRFISSLHYACDWAADVVNSCASHCR